MLFFASLLIFGKGDRKINNSKVPNYKNWMKPVISYFYLMIVLFYN